MRTRDVLLAWLVMIAVDLPLHAAVLAPLYSRPGPFLLPPQRSFELIPLGYASFLLMAVLLVWLATALQAATWRDGAVLGFKIGALVWGSFALGLLSISSAPLDLMVGWAVGQTLEIAIAGAFVGAVKSGMRYRRALGLAFALLFVGLLTVVVLQSTGIVEVPERRSIEI